VQKGTTVTLITLVARKTLPIALIMLAVLLLLAEQIFIVRRLAPLIKWIFPSAKIFDWLLHYL